MTNDSDATLVIEEPQQVSPASPGAFSRTRRKRFLVIVGVLVVLAVAAGLVGAYRYQPLSQTYDGQFGSRVEAWNSSEVAHTITQITGQIAPNTSGLIYEIIWTEPTGAYNVEVVVTINNSGSRAVTIDGFGSPLPGVAKRFPSYSLTKRGGYGPEGGKIIPFHSFALARHSSRVVIVDYTQLCAPSSTSTSLTSYTQLPVTYSFFGFRHTVGVPMDPYVIKRRSSCSLAG